MPTVEQFRRRRVAAAIILVLLITGVYFLLKLLFFSSPAPSPSPSPGAAGQIPQTPNGSASPGPTASNATGPTNPNDPGKCSPEALSVEVLADAAEYAVGQQATFTVKITNIGTKTCLVDGGTKAVTLTVLSGQDRIWSSQDCAKDLASRSLLLEPGMSDDRFQQVWKMERSKPQCPAGEPALGVGNYSVTATVAAAGGTGAASSPPRAFKLNPAAPAPVPASPAPVAPPAP